MRAAINIRDAHSSRVPESFRQAPNEDLLACAAELCMTTSRQAVGDDHPTTLRILNDLGVSMSVRGLRGNAEPLLLQALQLDGTHAVP